MDSFVLEKMATLRAAKLPDETGGVLIGTYDIQRRVVYLADVLPSPADSEEWPTLYIRGCEGLADQVGQIRRVTGHNLEYIGEWHSHPDGASLVPSDDDMMVFSWLTREMDLEGKPPLMIIAGEAGAAAPYLCQMANRLAEALHAVLHER
jgi:proteasome lid subunit RPN8/RPN11